MRRSAAILTGFFAIFLLLAYVIGLKYAAILFALAIPAAFMVGRRPWAWGILTGGILALLVFGLFDHMMNVVWPSSVMDQILE
jgi:hypothetical protein